MIAVVTLVLLSMVAIFIYLFLIWNFDYWRKRGVKCPKCKPLLGTFPSLLTQRQHFADDINDIYKQYKESDNFVGTFLMRTPQLMVLDPMLAHEVFVTAFKHFHDNDVGKLVDKKKDPLIANNPFILNGQDWREQRALASPGLTGSRIKVAYSVIQKVCDDLCDYIEQESKIAQQSGLNGKEIALRFTSENVSDSVLGIKAKSFTKQPIPISENVKKFAENNTVFLIYSLMVGIYPNIVNYYKAKFFPQDSEDFFINLMKEAFRIRCANRVNRHDFMNHLLELQEKNNLSYVELASHSMMFLIDGLDTTATVISHCLLLLARDPIVQGKLYREIATNLDESGELSFETLNDLAYLDACVHESLRIFPPGIWASKTCTEPYEFTNKDGTKLKILVGETMMIPIYSYHHDSKYYIDPEQFMPERFLPENGGVKKYRDMGVFLGFGDGPRTCLGMRFALVQSKAAIAAIVHNFHIGVNPKTKMENKLDPKIFLAIQDGGVWLDFEKRKL